MPPRSRRTFSASARESSSDDDDSLGLASSSDDVADSEQQTSTEEDEQESEASARKRLSEALYADKYSANTVDRAYERLSRALTDSKARSNANASLRTRLTTRAALLVSRFEALGCDVVFSVSTNTKRPRNITFATRRFRRVLEADQTKAALRAEFVKRQHQEFEFESFRDRRSTEIERRRRAVKRRTESSSSAAAAAVKSSKRKRKQPPPL